MFVNQVSPSYAPEPSVGGGIFLEREIWGNQNLFWGLGDLQCSVASYAQVRGGLYSFDFFNSIWTIPEEVFKLVVK